MTPAADDPSSGRGRSDDHPDDDARTARHGRDHAGAVAQLIDPVVLDGAGRTAAGAGEPARPVPTASTERGPRRRRRGRRRRAGTAARLAGFHAAVLAVVLGVVVAALVHQFSLSYEALAANSLVDELHAYTAAASRAAPDESLVAASVAYLQSRSLPAGTVLVLAFRGSRVLATPGADALRRDPAAARWITTPPPATVVETTRIGDKDTELLVAPIRTGSRTVGTMLAATDLSPLRAQRSRVLMLSLAEATVALLAGVLSSYLLLRRLLRTVGRITTTAEEIGRGELDRRLGDQGTDDEVGQLATTFDTMIGRVDEAMTAQRRLLSDVSHQLRTPLTVARGHLEVLQRTGGLADEQSANATVALVVDELDHMRALTERLLLLGRAMEPDFVSLEPVDVRAFVADLYDAARVLAPRRWSCDAVPDIVVQADSAKLRGALLNLVDNAVKATTADDAIAFVTTLDPTAGTVSFAVEDSGPGIPLAERAAVLTRFARPGARGEDGSGLGLAIARAVAEAHGGGVEVGESPLGGARVAVVLPPGRVGIVPEA
ncbi:MAG TPA: HAMP domain-containing sensor histidine kinase [Acidimicrobiales bacterium]|nr:HAMP domain-containing sensor histidine kinase [Acidimicrobiales bacterium]